LVLIPFAIDADSLTPDPAWTPAARLACHRDLLNAWQHYGLLTHDGQRFEGSRLQQAVLQLPQNVRPLWLEMLERAPIFAFGDGWNGAVVQANLPALATATGLALVDDTRAEVEFGIGEDAIETTIATANGEIDVCRLQTANQAKSFQEAIRLSGTHIEAVDTYQQIWDSRFRHLAIAPIKQISVVDRYAITKHRLCPQARLSGFERFARLLDAAATGPRYLTLYSAWTAEIRGVDIRDVEADLQEILRRCPNNNVRRIKVVMVGNGAFGDESHDRFIRFENHVWDLGLGLEVFEGPTAQRRSSATFKAGVVVAGYKQVELDLSGFIGVRIGEASRGRA
jgi:hypothetical protein